MVIVPFDVAVAQSSFAVDIFTSLACFALIERSLKKVYGVPPRQLDFFC